MYKDCNSSCVEAILSRCYPGIPRNDLIFDNGPVTFSTSYSWSKFGTRAEAQVRIDLAKERAAEASPHKHSSALLVIARVFSSFL